MGNRSTVDWIAMILVLIGGLNWGLVGAFEFNLVDTVLGEMSMVSRVVYVLVGISAIYIAATSSKMKQA